MATVTLDDRDPDIIYSAGWTQGGASTEYKSTTTYTDAAGATMTLTFQGTNVSVYGTIGSSNSQRVAPQTTYQLDRSAVVTYVPILMRSAQHLQLFYQSAQFPYGRHTLVVTNVIGACDPFFIDYLVVQTGNASSSTIVSPTALVSNSASQHPSRTAVIAGSVCAALAGVFFLGLMYFWMRRRKRRDSLEISIEPEALGIGALPHQPTMSQRLASVNPKKLPSTQLRPANPSDQGASSHGDSAPPAYIP